MLRISRLTLAAATIALCAASPTAAHAISPDALDAGMPTSAQQQDKRSPDAASPFESTIDQRAPDNRFGQPNGESIPVVAPVSVRVVEVRSNGFEWGDAGIGAAGMLAIVLVGVGAAMANAHRQARRVTATTTR
jgi:hypothetical protein